MARSEILTKVGSWAFIIGIIIALLVGLVHAWGLEGENPGDAILSGEQAGTVAWVLAILGILIGILAILGTGTITKKETPGFLMAGIALVVMFGVFSEIEIGLWLGSLLKGISLSLAIFVAPAVGILAIKAIWDMGKDV